MTIAKETLAKQNATSLSTRMSLEEYLDYDDGTEARYELVDGILFEMGAESQINIVIASFLFSVFLPFVPYYRIQKGTEVEVKGRYANTRIPDLMILTEEGVSALTSDKRSLVTLEMPAPALVVEMVSSSDRNKESYERDYVQKREEYARRRIPEYWLIDPIAETVIIFTLAEGKYHQQTKTGEQLIVSRVFPQIGTDISLSAATLLKGGMA